MPKKVYVEGGDGLISYMFKQEGWVVVKDLQCADLLCMEGGADVTPSLYGAENTHSYNNFSKDLSSLGLLKVAELTNLPVVGICRGSQIMCVAAGGKMKQHITGHGRNHKLVYEGVEYDVSSTHHQEVVPPVHEQFITRAADDTVEITDYRSIGRNWIGCQFHPEYFNKGHECRTLFFNLVEKVM